MSYKDVAERAALTFGEAFLVVVGASGTDLINLALYKGAALAGAAALVSFALNTVRALKAPK